MEIDYDLLAEKIAEKLKIPAKRIRIDGIEGLAKYLGCSKTTAQALKNNGEVVYHNVGRKVFFYSDEIDSNL